jgi:hypothetical protein
MIEIGRERSRLIRFICEEWFEAQEYLATLDSEVVYERLIDDRRTLRRGRDGRPANPPEGQRAGHSRSGALRPRSEGQAWRYDHHRDRALVVLRS